MSRNWARGSEGPKAGSEAGSLPNPPPIFLLDRVSLHSSGCLETHDVDQAGFKVIDLPASASLRWD